MNVDLENTISAFSPTELTIHNFIWSLILSVDHTHFYDYEWLS